jgi:ABC-2 type transport system permease protein
MPLAVRACPTLFRVGLSEMIAYRAEFFVWILTTNMPLVMLSLWSAVAVDGSVGRFGRQEFVAYYVATLLVRLVTNTWMVWELTMDVREGKLAARLLRPLHPLLAYGAQHLAAVPLRVLVCLPLVLVLLLATGDQISLSDPTRLAVFALSVVGAWLLLFFMMSLIGSLALFIDSALVVFEIWLGFHFILSGYLIPIELLPPAVRVIADVLPFRYVLGFPVETLIGLLDTPSALRALAVQWLYVGGLFAATVLCWRAGMRRYVAFGG